MDNFIMESHMAMEYISGQMIIKYIKDIGNKVWNKGKVNGAIV